MLNHVANKKNKGKFSTSLICLRGQKRKKKQRRERKKNPADVH
jgi:hypothetical protein